MKTAYIIRAIPSATGAAPSAAGSESTSSPTAPGNDTVFLRDGSACEQADAILRVQLDPGLLYATQNEAARDGLARLRAADKRSEVERARR